MKIVSINLKMFLVSEYNENPTQLLTLKKMDYVKMPFYKILVVPIIMSCHSLHEMSEQTKHNFAIAFHY